MAEKIIISMITLLIMLCVFAYFVDVLAIISKNMEFQDICRGYMHLAEQNAGLTYEHKISVVQDLNSRGFDNVVVQAPESAIYGSMFSLNIQASYQMNMINDIFSRNFQKYVMCFSQNIMARKIR